ncbi:MAG: prepilin peptidase [Nocardioidaceae bacterium]|nr:prepilin peptidase [Nocardioidaceae bacterium]
MSADWGVVALSAVLTASLASFGPAVIARLPEPAYDADAADKVLYRDLATRRSLPAELAAAGALAGAGAGWRLGESPLVVTWIFLCAVGVILAYVDARTRLLPTRIIAPSYGIVIGLVLTAAAVARDTQLLVRSASGWAIMGGVYLVMWLIYPRGLGYGDVRLAGLLGLGLGAVGWGSLGAGLYAGFLIGGIGGLALIVTRREERHSLPFGPSMVVGALVGVVWGDRLAHWYASW